MYEIHPKLITDANQHPIAVQIDYAEWLEIERLLDLKPHGGGRTDLSKYAGTLAWGEDAVAYQRRVREEWDR